MNTFFKKVVFLAVATISFLHVAAQTPSAVIFYNTAGSTQLTFNNAITSTTQPVFGVGTPSGNAPNLFSIEINTKPDFTGTSTVQTFTGTYTSGNQYNLTFTNNFNPVSGTTYYVRADASSNNGGSYGSYSADTFSFTYETTGNPAWFQTTQAQFQTDVLSGLTATAGSGVQLTSTTSSPDAFTNPSFEDSLDTWLIAAYTAEEGSAALDGGVATSTSPIGVSAGTHCLDLAINDGFEGIWEENDYSVAGQEVNLTGVDSINFTLGYLDEPEFEGNDLLFPGIVEFAVVIDPTNSLSPLTGTVVADLFQDVDGSAGFDYTPEYVNLKGLGYTGNVTVKFINIVVGDEFGDAEFLWGDAAHFYVDNVQTVGGTPSGNITSSNLLLGSVVNATNWKNLIWSQTQNGGNITFNIQKHSLGGWTNAITGITSATDGNNRYSLSSLGSTGVDSIKIFATFTTTLGGTSPSLNSWSISTSTPCTPPNVAVADTNATCGNNNGIIDLTVSGGAPPYTYSWSNSATTPNLGSLAANTYTVTVTDTTGCSTSTGAIISQLGVPSANAIAINATCGNNSGAVNITVSGGVLPYTYSWSNDSITQNISGLGANTYNVTITDANGCTGTGDATVTQLGSPSGQATVTNATCGNNNGAINLTVSGGGFPYNYSWSNSATTKNISGLDSATYTVIITDANSCADTISAKVLQLGSPSGKATATNASCGNSNGAVNITVSGGTMPYTYSWTNSITTQNITSLAANTYYVTITDANGCTDSTGATVTQLGSPSVSATPTDATCGSNNGKVTLTVSGGATPYTYSWSNGATTKNLTRLDSTTYTVTVTDDNHCTATASAIVTKTFPPVLTASSDTICSGVSTPLNVSGASTYTWTPAASLNASTGATVTATPSSTTTYTITGTNSGGCTGTTTAKVTVNPGVITFTPPSPSVTTGGSVNVIASATSTNGGVTYSWSPSTGLNTTTGDTVIANPGSTTTYTVTATDGGSCSTTGTVTVTLTAFSVSDVSCGYTYSYTDGITFNSMSGATTLATNSGMSNTNYTINLSSVSPAFTFDFNGTTYDEIGLNTNGFLYFGTAPPANTTQPIASTSASSGIISGWGVPLQGDGSGSISYLVSGTSPNRILTVEWTNVQFVTNAGEHFNMQIILNENNPAGTKPNNIAFNYSDQSAQFVSGQVGNVQIGLRGSTNSDFNDRTGDGGGGFGWDPSQTSAGTTDAEGVDFIGGIFASYISGNDQISFTPTINTPTTSPTGSQVACSGGGVTLTANTTLPASNSATYQWYNLPVGTPILGATNSTYLANPLTSGTYYYAVGVSNGSGCSRLSATDTVTTGSGGSLSITVSPSAPAICGGGSAILTASGAGAGTYSWSPATNLSATTGSSVSANPTVTTTYTVTGTASGGCTGTDTVVVSVGTAPVVNVSGAEICSGSSAPLTASGATSFTWSPATNLSGTTGSSVTANPTITTTYTVIGSNPGGCADTVTAVVTVDSAANVKVASTSICTGASANLTATGADTYTWAPAGTLNSSTGSSVNANPIATTTYTVTGTVSGGCSGSATAVVTVNQLPTVSVPSVSVCNGASTPLTASGALTYTWAPGTGLDVTAGTTVNATPSATSTYTVTGTDVNGCTGTDTSVVRLYPLTVITVPGASECQGAGTTLSATGGVTYTWAPNTGLNTTTGASVNANPSITTTYTISGTDGNGCTGSTTAVYTINAGPSVSVPSQSTCQGTGVSLIASGATTYTWAPGTSLNVTTGDTVTANPSSTTTYTITGTTGSCSGTTTAVVTVNNSLSIPVATAGSGANVNEITANWISVPGATSYYLDVSTDNNFGSFVTGYDNVNVGNKTSEIVTGLSLSTTYYYRVRANNSCSTSSSSNVISYSTTAASPCSNLNGGTVTPGNIVVCASSSTTFANSGFTEGGTLQWQVSVDNVNWTNVSGATDSTYTTAAINQKEYYRCLLVFPSCYNISSTTGVANVSATPVVTLTNVTSSSVTVSWTPYGSGQYNISWAGAGTGSASAVTTDNYVITGLNANQALEVTVTPAIPVCGGANAGTANTVTLCGTPVILQVVAAPAPAHAFTVTWEAVNGASSYRVYYRDLFNNTAWSFVDTAGTNKTITVPLGGQTYAVYVAAKNCPATGDIGQPSTIYYVTTNPPSGCSPVPSVNAASNCPNQITVGLNGTGPFELTVREISPVVASAVTVLISNTAFNITIGSSYAGTTWEIFARTSCGGGNYSNASNIAIVTVKPTCPATNNLVLSQVNCTGFTASWNTNTCNGIGVVSYSLLIKQSGVLNYSAYPAGDVNDKVVSFLSAGKTYDVVVLATACNGAPSPYSLIDTVTIPACAREEESAEPNTNNASQQESVAVYPNPSNGQFYVDLGRTDMSNATVKIELINQLGQVVETQLNMMSGGHMTQVMNTPEGLATGIYFVRTSVEGNVYVNRLMIDKN